LQEKLFSLSQILGTLYKVKNKKAKKRYIYDKSHLGLIGSKWLKLSFFVLPFIMYLITFNPISFEYLGIAQAVVVFIVLLVVSMQLVFLLSYFNNKKVLRLIEESWKKIFPTVELEQVISSGATPYKDFIKKYNVLLEMNLNEEALSIKMNEMFKAMQEENSELFERMNPR